MRRLLDLVDGDTTAAIAGLADTELNYPQANGDPELRERIARCIRARPPRTFSSPWAPSRPISPA